MNSEWQTWAALIVVAIAAVLLVRSALRKRKNPGCGGGCACPTDDFKKQLRRP
jgi:hypothetical protein